MKIKTYLVPTLAEAVEKIKRDLGPDAVILSTRKAPPTTRWRMLGGQPKLEVTAALDVKDPAAMQAVRPESVLRQTSKIVTDLTEERLNPLREELARIKQSLGQFVNGQDKKEEAPVDKESTAKRFASQPSQRLRGAGGEIVKISQNLLWHRLDPQVVQELADHLMSQATPTSQGKMEELAASWMRDKLPKTSHFHEGRSRERLLAVLGPTGSGKTTTLVKLASHLALEKKQTLAFITLDHFRIGAEEQLRKYASILGVPCQLAVDKKEFQDALKKFSHVDTILIDTAGRSPFDQEGLKRVQNTLDISQPIWKSLVISANLHEPDLSQNISQFRATDVQNLILTKLDETTCFGGLFNASYGAGLPLCYFTMGQQVPEDIEIATKERVIDCLFNFSGLFPIPEHTRHQWKDNHEEQVGRALQ